MFKHNYLQLWNGTIKFQKCGENIDMGGGYDIFIKFIFVQFYDHWFESLFVENEKESVFSNFQIP